MKPENQTPSTPSPVPDNSQEPSHSSRPSTGFILQPITSEDELRREIADNNPSVPDLKPEHPEVDEASESYASSQGSTLRTEPVALSMPANPAAGTSNKASRPAPRKKGITLFSVISLIILIGVAGFIWYLFFSERISTSDLVEESISNTTYLRPQQWKKAEIGTSSFGLPDIEDGKYRALVATSSSAQSVPGFSGQVSEVKAMRSMLMNMLNEETFTGQVAGEDAACQPTAPLEKTEDTTKTDKSFGLFQLSLSCTRENVPYTMKIRGIIGQDGHTRMINLMAKDSTWKQNDKPFKSMLMSLDQTSN